MRCAGRGALQESSALSLAAPLRMKDNGVGCSVRHPPSWCRPPRSLTFVHPRPQPSHLRCCCSLHYGILEAPYASWDVCREVEASRLDVRHIASIAALCHSFTTRPSGNTLVIGGTTAVTIAITWGGVFAPWGSSKVLVPLIVGLVVLGLFILWEARWATDPLVLCPVRLCIALPNVSVQVPFSLMSNRTSLSGCVCFMLDLTCS